MKQKIFFGLVFMLMNAMMLRASGDRDPVVRPEMAVMKTGEKVKVIYDGGQPVSIKVEITDASGTKVFSEGISQPGSFIRPYDLSQLPDGIYTVKVSDGRNAIEKDVDLGKTIDTRRGALMAHVSELDSQGERKFVFSIPRQNLENVTVSIIDDDDRVLYQQEVEAGGGYAVIYNIKYLKEGENVGFRVTDESTGEQVAVFP